MGTAPGRNIHHLVSLFHYLVACVKPIIGSKKSLMTSSSQPTPQPGVYKTQRVVLVKRHSSKLICKTCLFRSIYGNTDYQIISQMAKMSSF